MITFDESLYYYNAKAAGRVIDVIQEYCTHVRGDKAGEPLILAEFWKEDIIKPAFGILKRSNNKRRFKTVYVEIGKGNAKSTVGSGLALYLTGFDGAKGASVYSVASDTKQARIIFDTAKFMIQQSPYLQQYFEPYMYSIVKKGTPCFYQVLSGEEKGKHGLIPSAIIFDEVHEQRDRELWDAITAGQMKIDDSLTIAFTTAGYDKQSICWELHTKAVDIKSGKVQDDSFLGVIYSAPESDDISKPSTWRKANPGLGEIITEENLRIEYNKVMASPGYENTFRRLHLNQWTDVHEAFISDTEWMGCDKGGNKEENKGRECYGGLDLASTRDFNSLCLLFPLSEDEANVMMWFWIPEDMIDQRLMRQTLDMALWVKNGDLITLPGNAVDHSLIISHIRKLSEDYLIQSIGYDRKFAAPIVVSIQDEVLMNPFEQSIMNMSYPTKKLDQLIAQKKLNHYGNPVLRWMNGNVKIYRDANDNIKIVKHKSTDKVDGMIALVMAIGEWEAAKMTPKSKYDDPDYELISF